MSKTKNGSKPMKLKGVTRTRTRTGIDVGAPSLTDMVVGHNSGREKPKDHIPLKFGPNKPRSFREEDF